MPDSPPSPAALLVDLDGTLYAPGPLKRRMALELLLSAPLQIGPLRRFRRAHERLRQAPERIQAGETPFDAQLRLAAEELGWPPERLRQRVEKWMIERPCRHLPALRNRALLEELAEHKRRGLALALVSDYPARRKLAALGAADLFAAVVASGEPGGPERLKPDPAGYLRAARELGVAPERCLVLGDRPDADGLAAERAGMGFRHVRCR